MSAASEKSELWTLAPIAHIHTDFTEKFGIPRQSGLVAALNAFIVFTPEYRDPAALRGIEGYDYLWLLWRFSANPEQKSFSPTVRPPRLGGNKRMGVFATRSPIRPNPVGLSSVRLLGVEDGGTNGAVLRVAGADLLDPGVALRQELARKEQAEIAVMQGAGEQFPKLAAFVAAAHARPAWQRAREKGGAYYGY